MRLTKIIWTLSAIALLPFAGFSATIIVPNDYSTIQGAIDASVSGDTIMVVPGTYDENIDFLGKNITVQSMAGPGSTTIRGDKTTSVVVFVTGETSDAVLDGFTVTNGFGYPMEGHMGTSYYGGAVYCELSGPVVKNNIFFDNASEYGGGFAANDATPTLINNTIYYNTASKGAGAIWLGTGDSVVANNVIYDNDSAGRGGAIYGMAAIAEISGNLIFRNHATRTGAGFMWFNTCEVTLNNNTVFGNTADEEGGGIYVWGSTVDCKNCIFWNNSGSMGDEGMLEMFMTPAVMTIDYSDVDGGPSSFEVSDSTLNWGNEMIDIDPLFEDSSADDFHLTWLSPCINRGTVEGLNPEDCDGDSVPYMGAVDMGYDEFVDTHTLEIDTNELPESGGSVYFDLAAGVENADRKYFLLSSATGTAPGTPLPGNYATLRLDWDIWTEIVLSLSNTVLFQDFIGFLDNNGNATAIMNAPSLPTGYVGLQLHFAYCLKNTYDFVSNPVTIEIVQ